MDLIVLSIVLSLSSFYLRLYSEVFSYGSNFALYFL